jgi:hypothetical protein
MSIGADLPVWETTARVVECMSRQGNLLEVIGTLDSGRGLADFLNGRQQQPHEYRDDGDYDEQFEKSYRSPSDRIPHNLLQRWADSYAPTVAIRMQGE